jgi:histidine triad (HIT) family protein
MPTTCLFCRIVSGEVPARKVHEDERLVAFHDVHPQAPFHVLVVPRVHVSTLNDLGASHDGLVGEMIRRGAALVAAHGYGESGYRTVFNCHADAGQAVFHVHLHVLAGRKLGWPPG